MDYNTSLPIYLQVIDSIKKQLVTGKLKPEDQLPSARNLALLYNINPNTAARIYKELEAEGICFTKRGLGTFVTSSKDKIATLREPMANRVIEHFITEMMDLGYNHEDMIKIIKERA